MLSSNGAFAGTFDPYEGKRQHNRICDFSDEVALHYEVIGQTTSILHFLVRGYKEIKIKAPVEVVIRLPSLSLGYHSVDRHSAVNQTEPANFQCRMKMNAVNMRILVREALKIILKWRSTRLDADALARTVYREDDIFVARENQDELQVLVRNLLDIVRKFVLNGTSLKFSNLSKSLDVDPLANREDNPGNGTDIHLQADVPR